MWVIIATPHPHHHDDCSFSTISTLHQHHHLTVPSVQYPHHHAVLSVRYSLHAHHRADCSFSIISTLHPHHHADCSFSTISTHHHADCSFSTIATLHPYHHAVPSFQYPHYTHTTMLTIPSVYPHRPRPASEICYTDTAPIQNLQRHYTNK